MTTKTTGVLAMLAALAVTLTLAAAPAAAQQITGTPGGRDQAPTAFGVANPDHLLWPPGSLEQSAIRVPESARPMLTNPSRFSRNRGGVADGSS